MKLGVGVNKVDKGPKGSIILNIPRKEDQATLRDELKKNLGETYKVQVPERKLPRIKIVGIENNLSELTEEEIINKISTQNKLEKNKS